jgi:hypothetical protein
MMFTGAVIEICDRCHSLKLKLVLFALKWFWPPGRHWVCATIKMLMTSKQAHAVYVVAGTCGDKIQYWVAAVARKRAAQEVRNVLGPQWKTTVLNWRLTPDRLAKLNLSHNSVRKIGYDVAIR